MSENDIEALKARVKAWVESPEGARALLETMKRAKEASDEFTNSTRVTREMLNREVTI